MYALVPFVGTVLFIDVALAVEAILGVGVGVRVGSGLEELHVFLHDGQVLQKLVFVRSREQKFGRRQDLERTEGLFDLFHTFKAAVCYLQVP